MTTQLVYDHCKCCGRPVNTPEARQSGYGTKCWKALCRFLGYVPTLEGLRNPRPELAKQLRRFHAQQLIRGATRRKRRPRRKTEER